MILPRLQAAGLLITAALTPAAPGASGKDEPPTRPPAAITVKMENCQASRPGKLAQVGLLRLLFFGPPQDRLVKRGALDVDGEKYDLYLPAARSYTTRNQAKDGGGGNGSKHAPTVLRSMNTCGTNHPPIKAFKCALQTPHLAANLFHY